MKILFAIYSGTEPLFEKKTNMWKQSRKVVYNESKQTYSVWLLNIHTMFI